MTSIEATLIFAWAAVHAYIAIYYFGIFARRQTDIEHLAYAFMSVGLGTYCVGGALLCDATSVAEATLALRLFAIGGPVALAGYVAFAFRLLAVPSPRLPRTTIGWVIVGTSLSCAGLLFDPSVPTTDGSQPALSVVGILWAAFGIGMVALLLVRVVGAVRKHRDLRVLLAATTLGGAAYLADAAPQLFGRPLPGLLSHVSIVITAALGQLLLTRFSETDAELEKRTRELEESYAELSHAQNELVRREQLAAVGELSAVIAHEIRNPLAILRNAASGLRRPTLAPKDRATLLEILNEEIDALARLVSDLSTYAQPVVTAHATVTMEELLREALEAALGAEVSHTIRVDIDVDPNTPVIDGDPVLLERAFTNVLDNSAQAMQSGGTIAIGVRPTMLSSAPAVEVIVTDTGEGMDSAQMKKALDPFFTTRARGTGLGLAIVDRVVRAHGGTVALESAIGEGTTVRLILPVRPAQRLSTPETPPP